jgi:hypothetical protein
MVAVKQKKGCVYKPKFFYIDSFQMISNFRYDFEHIWIELLYYDLYLPFYLEKVREMRNY